MKLRLFSDLEARLSRVRLVDDKFIYHRPKRGDNGVIPGKPAINHFGLWNEYTARLTQMRPFLPPAVFVEFLPAAYSPLQHGAIHSDMTIRLHVVTATLAETDTSYREEALSRFLLCRAIIRALAGFAGGADDEGRSYSVFQYSGSITDHNHDQVCEDIEEWRTHCVDCSITLDDGFILTDTNVSLDTGDIFTDAFSDSMV